MSDPILSYLTERTSDMVALLDRFVSFDSPAQEIAAVEELARSVVGACQERGGDVERVSGEGKVADHLRVAFPGHRAGEKPVLVLAHIDTVWGMGETTRRPFQVENGRATGPGSYDMKAGLVQALFALEVLRATGRQPNRPVVLLVTTDEETGSAHSRKLIEAEARKAGIALVVEPSTGPGALKTARKGIGMYTMKITGKAAHAGLEPQAGVSALLELAHQIMHLHSLNDFAAGITVTVGVASGGTRRNVVPAEAEAHIDLRVVSDEQARRMDHAVKGLKPHLEGATVTVTGGMNRPPMERTPAITGLFAQAREIAADLGFTLEESSTGGGSDGNFTAALGVPTLDGLGAVGGGAHALTEHVLVSEMPRRAALLAHLLERL